MAEEHDSYWNDADWPIGTSPPLSASGAARLKTFLATYPEDSGAPLRTGPLNGASTATSSTPPGAAPALRPTQMRHGETGHGGCGTHGGCGNGEVDGERLRKPRRTKKRGSAAADDDTDGGRKKPKCDKNVASLLAAVYEDKLDAMQAVLPELKLGHAGKSVNDTTPTDAVLAVTKAFRAELRELSLEICTMLVREGEVPSEGGIKHALLNSGAAIEAIHGTFVQMGAPEAEQKVYSAAIEKLIVGNHDAAAKVVWDDVRRVQSAAAKRMARVATDVGKVLRERMTGRVGVVAHAPTREATVNAYLTLLMEMREADEMMHGAGVLPAWLRKQIFWGLVAGSGNRYGGPAVADIAQASRHTTFAPNHAWHGIFLSVQQATDVPEICRALFWVIFSAASGACLLPEPETYLERMVLATSVKNKRKDETEQETRGVSTYLLGAQEREWYSDDGQFSVSWKLIAAQVPGRIAFFLRIFQVCPATASACS